MSDESQYKTCHSYRAIGKSWGVETLYEVLNKVFTKVLTEFSN